MTNAIIHNDGKNTKREIQTGPVYHCPECGAPCTLRPPRDAHLGRIPTWMKDWADHIAYLRLPTACKLAHHPCRFATLGTAAVNIVFPYDNGRSRHQITDEACIAVVREAVEYLAREIGPGGGPAHDPAAVIVHALAAGLIGPAEAIRRIRELVDRAMAGALLLDEAMPVFEVEVGR